MIENNIESLKCSCCKNNFISNGYKTCDKCRERNNKNRLKNKENIIKCKSCNCKKSENNDYCGKHQIDYFKEETEKEGFKICINVIRGCRSKLNLDYEFSKCDDCLKKDRNKYNNIEEEIKEIIIEKNNELQKCSGCRKKCILYKNYKTCELCYNKTVLKNSKTKEKRKVCKLCNYSCINDINDYCKFHQIENTKNELEQNELTLCFNYIGGCNNEININDIKCKECYENDKNYDIELKNCSVCNKDYCKKFFNGINTETKTCLKCRNNNKIADLKRDKEHRNELSRISEKNPDRIEIKNKWKLNNYEKVMQYWIKSRGNKINSLGIEEYRKREANYAKMWREENPDKVEEMNNKRYSNVNMYFEVYKKDAFIKNINFELTKEQFINIVNKECYYCGIIQEKGFNGIDKKDCYDGYILDNCVSCCEMCNFMKGTLSINVFIKKIEHILTYHNIIESGKLYPDIFNNTYSVGYYDYNKRALKQNKLFELTYDEFIQIIDDICYICGKENNEYHINGIDKINNEFGYNLDNVGCCCGGCNYIKNNYDLDDLINKFIMIYYNTKDYDINNDNNIIKHNIKHLNKKSKE